MNIFPKKSLLLFLFLSCCLAGAYGQKRTQLPKGQDRVEAIPASHYIDIDTLMENGLDMDAQELAFKYYNRAKAIGDLPEKLKAACYILQLKSKAAERQEPDGILWLEREMDISGPGRYIMLSMLAKEYELYYQRNRYSMRHITDTDSSIKNDSIKTWSQEKFDLKIKQLYTQSISDAGLLQKTPTDAYVKIIDTTKLGQLFEPTLYDLLINRAIAYFNEYSVMYNNEVMDTIPGFSNPLLSQADFMAIKFPEKPKSRLTTTFYLYQCLLKFHIEDKNPEVLVLTDLKRIKFARSVVTVDDGINEPRYRKCLQELEQKYKAYPISALPGLERAVSLNNSTYIGDTIKRKKVLALNICKEYLGLYPNGIAAISFNTLMHTIIDPRFSVEGRNNYPTKQQLNMAVHFTNVPKLYGRIYKINANLGAARFENDSFSINTILKMAPVETVELALPNKGNYEDDTTTIKIESLVAGRYIMLFNSNKEIKYASDVKAIKAFQISRLSYYILKDTSKFLYVHDVMSGAPIKGANVNLYTNKASEEEYSKSNQLTINTRSKLVKKLKTDANGKLLIPKAGYNRIISIVYQKDTLEFFEGGEYQYRYNEPATPKEFETHFLTDRAVYRPGQTVYFKGIMLEKQKTGSGKRVVPGYEDEVNFLDANDEEIAEMKLKTNDFGSYTGSFKIPASTLNGTFKIEDDFGNVDVQVEEYKRPKTEITFEPDTDLLIFGKPVEIRGTVKGYEGSGLANVAVKYSIGKDLRPYVRNGITHALIPDGKVMTDEKGVFKIIFTPTYVGEATKYSSSTYYISVDVTDLTGESHQAEKSIEVHAHPLQSNLVMENYLLGNSNGNLALYSHNGSGVTVRARGTLVLQKMKEPTMPVALTEQDQAYDYSSSNYNTPVLDIEKEVYINRNIKSNKNYTLGGLGIKDLPQGHYRMIFVTDTAGIKDTVEESFIVINPDSKELAINDMLYVHSFDRDLNNNNHSIRIVAGSAKRVYARLIVTVNGVKKIEKILLINHEQQWINIPIQDIKKSTIIESRLFCVNENAFGTAIANTTVHPYIKSLQIKTITFRDKTEPGSAQHWQLRIRDEKGLVLASEMVASLYDASLDAIKRHDFNISEYNADMENDWNRTLTVQGGSFYSSSSYYNNYAYTYRVGNDAWWMRFDDLAINVNYNYGYRNGNGLRAKGSKKGASHLIYVDGVPTGSYNIPKDALEEVTLEKTSNFAFSVNDNYSSTIVRTTDYSAPNLKNAWQFGDGDGKDDKPSKPITIRKQLQELAFFYPQLRTNDSGDVVLDFKMPEALTRWKLLAFAHTKDFVTGNYENTTVTRKPLMIIPNLPRFLREGDSISFAARVSSGNGVAYIGKAQLEILDPDTHKPVSGIHIKYQTVDFALKDGQSLGLNWDFKIPDGMEGFLYRLTASSGNSSDGEEGYIPVLPRRMMVTETMPMSMHSRSQKSFDFKAYLEAMKSSTATPYRYNLEISANPAWYAVHSLPYLLEFPHECNEQLFNRIFANVVASHIVSSNPKIKQVFDAWARDSSVAKSALEKNPEIKLSALAETPWLADGKNESQRTRNIAKLFDTARVNLELENAIGRLERRQNEDGSWPWFPGMVGSRFITQYIFVGMGHMEAMRAFGPWTDRMRNMMGKARKYMDKAMLDDYNALVKSKANMKENHLSAEVVQYLYARCRYPVTLQPGDQIAYAYWQDQMATYWNTRPLIEKAMAATTLWTLNEDRKARQIMKALKQQATISDEMGMYWKNNTNGYGWNERPVETQAMLLEAFSLIDKEQSQCNDIKTWLLKNKQTHAWSNTKATADACYAILYSDTTLNVNRDVQVYFGKDEYVPEKDSAAHISAGTAWFSKSWQKKEIKGDMGHVRLVNNGNDPAWGAVYYQYMEDMSKVKQGGGNLSITKDITVVHHTANGDVLSSAGANTTLKLGDRVRVRIIIKSDRELEYVQLKDTRAAALEPVENESGIRYGHTLRYYEDIKDASINFFMDYVPKGTHVFEYDLRASQLGEFLNGNAEIQCMYAPEFSAHTGGIILKVQK